MLAVSPRCSGIFASRSALANSACSASPGFCAQPVGVMNIHATRNASVKAVFFMSCPPSFYFMVALGLPFQHRIQAVEDRHATLNQILVIRSGLGESLDREVDPRRFAARELAALTWLTAKRSRVGPHVELGGGTLFTNAKVPRATSQINFTAGGAVGLHFLRSKYNISTEVRYMHISNAGLATPNPGINTIQFRIGFGLFSQKE